MFEPTSVPMPRTSKTLALSAGLIGVLTLVGWHLDLPPLRTGSQNVAMNPVSAILFILTAFGIVFLPRGFLRGCWRVSRIVGGVVLVISTAKVASFFGFDFSLDRQLYTASLALDPFRPNRMAPNTVLALLLLGAALLLMTFPTRRTRIIPQILSLCSIYIGFQALLGYLFGTTGIFEMEMYTPMALNSSIAVVCASLAILLSDPNSVFVSELNKNLAGGILGRRLIPMAVLIPIIIGALRYRGQAEDLYSREVGVTLMITAMVISLVTLVWWSAKNLNQYDANLHESMRDLHNLNRELETFSYSVSHDLRAPLRSIGGFSSILLEEHSASLDEEAKAYLHRIGAASARMGKLIDGLLDLSRLSRKGVQNRIVNLTRIVETIFGELQAADPGRKVTVHFQPNVMAVADPDLITIVLQNLIGNAWKFSSKSADAQIEFGTQETVRGRTYFVKDNGAGFDMQHSRNLFSPFQRLHGAHEFEGTGIGLATVQRIVNRHRGHIWAEAKPQKGATFFFTLQQQQSHT